MIKLERYNSFHDLKSAATSIKRADAVSADELSAFFELLRTSVVIAQNKKTSKKFNSNKRRRFKRPA